MRPWKSVAFIEGWYVEPAWQGQGIGRALIEAAEAYARAAGHHEIASDAEIENAEAMPDIQTEFA